MFFSCFFREQQPRSDRTAASMASENRTPVQMRALIRLLKSVVGGGLRPSHVPHDCLGFRAMCNALKAQHTEHTLPKCEHCVRFHQTINETQLWENFGFVYYIHFSNFDNVTVFVLHVHATAFARRPKGDLRDIFGVPPLNKRTPNGLRRTRAVRKCMRRNHTHIRTH